MECAYPSWRTGWIGIGVFLSYGLVAAVTAHAADLADPMPYPRGFEIQTIEMKRKTRSIRVWKGALSVAHPTSSREQSYSVPFIFYESLQRGARPLVVVYPSIVGVTAVESDVASSFARNGYHAVISALPEDIADQTRPIADIGPFLTRTTIASRHLIDFAMERWPVQSDRIYCYGLSLGAIRSSLAFGVESRFRKCVTYVGGGNIPELILRTQQSILVNYRNARMKEEKIGNPADLLRALRALAIPDPLHYAYRRDSSSILMFIGLKDQVVPTPYQLSLWESFGKPEAVFVDADHVRTGARYASTKSRVRVFFER